MATSRTKQTSPAVNVTIRQKNVKGTSQGWEGTVALPGLRPTKLARKDGTTLFNTTGALKTVARNVVNKYGFSVEYTEPVKKAAKRSVKTATTKTSPKTSPKTRKTSPKAKTSTSKRTSPKAKTSRSRSK